jgi:acyl-CoA synthetase (AMP-forming)/AMP-acid ligase II
VSTIRPSLGKLTPEPVQQLVIDAARRWPQKTAIVDGNRRTTFSELDGYTTSLAVALQGIGVSKGDFVGILAPNCLEFEIAFFGILKAGATVTTINSGYREREVAAQLTASGAAVLIVHDSLREMAEAAAKDVATLQRLIVVNDTADDPLSFWGLIAAASGKPTPVEIDPVHDLAALPFSSGTTGVNKGVMLAHENLYANVRQLVDRDETNHVVHDDIVLVHLPLFHIYGMTALMQQALYVGATQVMMGRFDMTLLLSLIQDHQVTALYTAPPVGVGLSQTPLVDNYNLASLRFITFGAAPMSAELQLRIADRVGCTVIQAYGLTETSPVTHIDFADERMKPGSIGPPVPDVEQRVVDMETGLVDLGPNELGELLVRGANVMRGYYNQPEATAAAIDADGWFSTGDLVKIDEDGYVFVFDRKKELIKYSGFQVPPAELEGILLEHPSVADAAVIGKDDPEHGEIPKAFVVLKAGAAASDGELMDYVGDQVATFKRVREVEFVDAIPKNASGKLLRRVLVARERAKQAAR